MSPIATLIITFIQLGIKAAPEIQKVYEDAKKLITMMFNGGMITAEQQAIYMSWADEHQAATLAGQKPPELTIDP